MLAKIDADDVLLEAEFFECAPSFGFTDRRVSDVVKSGIFEKGVCSRGFVGLVFLSVGKQYFVEGDFAVVALEVEFAVAVRQAVESTCQTE